ncbi:type 1 glutamine amidotransferase domain-containing protein [Bdellovibrio bacteriovorus]|uniref:type 1 glutamine amidotransferase domain-containing protein n=1 Tax=Bdellovibrio bacteriovorus TaxID=959 RepID=UPI003AA922F0
MKALATILAVLGLSVGAQAKEEGKTMKKALIVVTNHNVKGSTGQQTGWYLSEVTHVYYPLIKAGYKVEFASPKGGVATMDESSLDLKDPDNKKFVEDKKLMAQMQNTLAVSKVNAKDYQLIHFAGGHGAMWDFANSPDMDKLTAAIYESGGIVSAVCHGPAALVNVKLSNGEYLVKGKDVSAFTDAEENEVGLSKVVPFMLESTLRERGATMHPVKNWNSQAIVSERLVTGQNPQSGHAVAKKLVELSKTLK